MKTFFRKISACVSVIGIVTAISALSWMAASAQVMNSSNYKIESDSLNMGGVRSSSATYSLEDTLGEVSTGFSSSTNYVMHAGYQEMQVVGLAVVPPANITLSPSIGGVTGGTANGSTNFTVTTDDYAGYSVTITASSSPALVSGVNYFPDYKPLGANPDFTFSVGVSMSTFGFSPKGADIVSRYLDNGLNACNSGSSQTAGACWDSLSVSPKTIVSRSSSNHPAGTVTTLSFRAASGSSNVQPNGTYVATTTITVIAL